MNETCDLPGAALAIERSQFPDPAFDPAPATSGEQLAVLAGGCFWCVEAVFRELDGVLGVTSGYSGGNAASANYEAVCSGRTDHAEAISIRFDPARISYAKLLKVFFAVAHDPTQVDRQGADRGRQYRSAIFYIDETQRAIAAAYIRQLDEAKAFSAPIATQLVPLEAFHQAEAYHQNYAAQHPAQPYIAAVAAPKVAKLRKQFGDWLRSDSPRDGGLA
ncbi:peptide-methionine (S)-S-oxide reductase MsrA [Dokdonella sp.]|uniref:peptide-methionine (S)-S-oxide reductase MsrA n=1 Tax=Dokdonella sp. TaxID=2291710 RepID=UPI001B0E2619|nr:peptide-methionine (S)-S-oxide reductase MsrA [Dokdonella sp.]MBO9661458.1 peptide-methionine (S)-S-oxide reductase MsrA [Dokdonella sp.]